MSEHQSDTIFKSDNFSLIERYYRMSNRSRKRTLKIILSLLILIEFALLFLAVNEFDVLLRTVFTLLCINNLMGPITWTTVFLVRTTE